MAKESFDVFCLECNIQVEARVISSGSGGFNSDSFTAIDQADAEYHGDVYHVALCRRCNAPFLIKEVCYGIPGEFETVTETSTLFPKARNVLLEGVPDSIRKSYDQALRCYGTSSFDACAVMCRRCLEALCRSFGIEKGTLEQKLKALAQNGSVESRLLEWAHSVRAVGNDAAHDTEVELTKDDARDALDFTEALLMYVFVLNARFADFQARRNKAKS